MAIGASSSGDLDRALRDLADKLAKGSPELRVGFLEGSVYPDGTSVPMVAAIQEYGAPAVGIPPRPFFRPMIAAKKGEWGDALLQALVRYNFDAIQALTAVGAGIAGQLRESIIQLFSPPLSPVTLMLRKMKVENPDLRVTRSTVVQARARVAAGEQVSGVSTKPLIETAHMKNSVDAEVKP